MHGIVKKNRDLGLQKKTFDMIDQPVNQEDEASYTLSIIRLSLDTFFDKFWRVSTFLEYSIDVFLGLRAQFQLFLL